MAKDFKIGLISGSILAAITLGYLATRPSLSPEARMLRSSQAATAENETTEPPGPPVEQQPLPGPVTTAPQGPVEPPDRTDANPPAQPPTSPFGQLLQEQKTIAAAQKPVEDEPAARDLTLYEREEKIETTRFHIVRKNETLSGISQQYYGSPNKWRKILDANKDTIPDANKISPGAKLIIPD